MTGVPVSLLAEAVAQTPVVVRNDNGSWNRLPPDSQCMADAARTGPAPLERPTTTGANCGFARQPPRIATLRASRSRRSLPGESASGALTGSAGLDPQSATQIKGVLPDMVAACQAPGRWMSLRSIHNPARASVLRAG